MDVILVVSSVISLVAFITYRLIKADERRSEVFKVIAGLKGLSFKQTDHPEPYKNKSGTLPVFQRDNKALVSMSWKVDIWF